MSQAWATQETVKGGYQYLRKWLPERTGQYTSKQHLLFLSYEGEKGQALIQPTGQKLLLPEGVEPSINPSENPRPQ